MSIESVQVTAQVFQVIMVLGIEPSLCTVTYQRGRKPAFTSNNIEVLTA